MYVLRPKPICTAITPERLSAETSQTKATDLRQARVLLNIHFPETIGVIAIRDIGGKTACRAFSKRVLVHRQSGGMLTL
jgi:hypothetical protein